MNHGHRRSDLKKLSIDQIELLVEDLNRQYGGGESSPGPGGKRIAEKDGVQYIFDPNAKTSDRMYKRVRSAADLQHFKQ